jgi:hypothetical protein
MQGGGCAVEGGVVEKRSRGGGGGLFIWRASAFAADRICSESPSR